MPYNHNYPVGRLAHFRRRVARVTALEGHGHCCAPHFSGIPHLLSASPPARDVACSALMKIESIRIGMRVRHPQYGTGQVMSLTQHTAEIAFGDGHRSVAPETCGLEPDEPTAGVTGLTVPLEHFLKQTVLETVTALGLEKIDMEVEKLGARWHGGKLVLHPADTTLQTKEVPLEVFFHKIVMMRNQLRVLEQKLNGHEQLTDGEKVELQQYISRCYGTMTTFNVLFRDKADYFSGKAE